MNRTISVLVVVSAVAFPLGGCATPSTKLQNASGHVVDCSASGFGVLGTAAALSMHSDCVNRMQAAGYRTVNANSVAPQPSPEAAKVDLVLPAGWARKPLTEVMANNGGSVYASHPGNGASVLVSVATKQDGVDMMAYVASRRSNQEARLLNPQSTEITRLEINGRQAFRFEVAGYVQGGIKITYQHTVIEGKAQLVLVNAWTKTLDYPEHKAMLEGLATDVTGLS